MYAIIRQAKANLKSRKLQAALILLTLFAAATLLTVALSTLRTAQGAYDRLFQRTHGAHLWLYLEPERVAVQEAEQTLARLPGVEATSGLMRHLPGTLFVDEERVSNQLLREWPDDTVTVGRPLLVAGRAPEPAETDAIVLDRNVSVVHGVRVGDTVDLLTPDGRRPLTVVGLFVTAEFCTYPNCSPAREYLARGAMTDLGLLPSPDADLGGLSVGLRLRDPTAVEVVRQAAEETLPPASITWWSDWRETRSDADFNLQLQRILLIVFSIVAVLASGFLIANTIGEAVRAQTRQIGLLKAVGFTRRQLTLVFLTEYLGVALIASMIGFGAGFVVASAALRSVAAQFGETLLRPPLWIALAVPLSTLLFAAFFTLWPVRRAVRLDVTQAIRTGAERPRRRAARLLGAPLPLAVGISDVLSRPLRSVFTALGLGMAVLTLIAALTLNATLRSFISDPNLAGFDGDLVLSPSNYMPEAEVRRLIAEQPVVISQYSDIWRGVQLQGEQETLYARFREGDLEAFRFPVVAGRLFERPDEVVIGYGLARERDLHPGDTLSLLLEGEPLTLRVVGIYREFSNMGRMLMMSSETLRRLEPGVEPYTYVLKLHPDADAQAVASALASASNDLLEILVTSEAGLPRQVASLRSVMVGLSLVLIGIAVVGVFNSVWMGVRERQRDFGMLKAVGMTPGQVMLCVLMAAVGLALIGYVIGMPVGLGGIRLLMDTVARQQGYGPLSPPVDGLGVALVLPGIVLLTIAGAFIPAHRAGRTSVVETLRYE